MHRIKGFKIIGFDADDTLWVNEPYYRETEAEFCKILFGLMPEDKLNEELFKTEMANLELYGYGAKGFVLSLVETALRLTNNSISAGKIEQIINLGKALLNRKNPLLEGVKETLEYLYSKNYKLILATKGDLLDQERKLKKSGLADYFHHIEVMSDKNQENYRKLLKHLEIMPEEFLMIGNSVKSDVIPVLKIGGKAIHIPYHTTWIHEEVNDKEKTFDYPRLENISRLKELL